MRTRINKNTFLLLSIIIFEAIIIKSFMYKLLPEKYFYDSIGLIRSLGNIDYVKDISRRFAIIFFSKINVFGFTSIIQWGWFISIFFNIIIIKYIFNNNKKYDLVQFVFIIMSVALLNIYVFNIGKDIIQFLIFFIVFLILKSKKSNNYKILYISFILIFEAFVFRTYYLIMASLVISIYLFYKLFLEKRELDKNNTIKLIIIGICIFLAEIFILRMISLENYNSVMFARSSVNVNRFNTLDAETIIYELFGNNNTFIIFVLNYISIFIRLLFPFELLLMKIKYLPFVVYQLIISFNLFKFGRKLNSNNLIWLIIVVAFLLTSAIFEPDFGSFVRHESTMFLIFLYMFILDNGYDRWCFNEL